MASFGSGQPIVRLNFSKIEKIIDIPNLIDVQQNSYESFLQMDYRRKNGRRSGCRRFSRASFPSAISTKPLPWSLSAMLWESPSMKWTSAGSGG